MSDSVAAGNPPGTHEADGGPILAKNSLLDLSVPISDKNRPPIFGKNRELPQTICELIEQLSRFDGQFARFPADDLRIVGDSLVTGGVRLRLDTAGIERLCQQMGLPHSYVPGLKESARTPLLNYHLAEGDHCPTGQHREKLNVVGRDGTFVGFARSDLADLRARELTAAVLEGLGPDPQRRLEVHRLSLADERCEFELLATGVYEEAAPGDVVIGGLAVRYSPIGRHAVSVETFLFRPNCANGLTHRWCSAEHPISRTRRLPLDHAEAKAIQFRQVRQLAVSVWQGLPQRLGEVAALREERLESVEAFLAQLLRPARLWTRPMRRYLQQALAAEEEQGTAYAALNAVTRVATHQPQLSARQRRALSALGGLIAHRHAHICPKCYSVVGR
ncbi:MAG: DUF932 domain-containing protein [Planctomycetes bacterium]|nr:DUF932 domain-containing protein [Planctomycetota bacterium]